MIANHLFVSDSDGALYDTRQAGWHNLPPLRAIYQRHMRCIRNAQELKAALREGATTDWGGLPLYFVMADGAAMSFAAVQVELRRVLAGMRDGDRDWTPVGIEVNYEDNDLYCAHTGDRIPAAYDD